jgi:hypothetical protein
MSTSGGCNDCSDVIVFNDWSYGKKEKYRQTYIKIKTPARQEPARVKEDKLPLPLWERAGVRGLFEITK